MKTNLTPEELTAAQQQAGTAQHALKVMMDMIEQWGREGMYRSATKMLVDIMFLFRNCGEKVEYGTIADSVEFCSMLISYFEQLCPEQED